MSLYFLFAQFEFTHALGPHAARYIVDGDLVELSRPAAPWAESAELTQIEARNEEVAGVSRRIGAADVLVVAVVSAPATMPRLLRRARPVESAAPPAEVPLGVFTFIKGTFPIADESEARRRVNALRFSEEYQDSCVSEALAVVNLSIRAYRAGAHDPYAVEVTRRDARAVRIGYGLTEEVQDGRWRDAFELPPPRGARMKRAERLRPAEAVAAVLSGRAGVLESEDLLGRALIDLDNRRTRAAAFQVSAAVALLPTEVGSMSERPALDLSRLEPYARRAGELQSAAEERPLDPSEVGELEAIIDLVDELLDAWRYAGTA